ncbi:MAG: hypothetical protein KDD34_01925, partial [Bdellovibrionales bacterium]|nr:hypothetical protein [Bdellovibrionales bacterium]
MWNFNSKSTLGVFLISTLLVGCLKADKKDESELKKTSANFLVQNVDAKLGPVDFVKGWSIPEKNDYYLKACIIDRVTRDRLIGHEFRVESDGIQIPKPNAVTDNDGCIQWVEEVPFQFFGEPRYLKMSRKIVGTGVKRGEQIIEFAIDPWKITRGGAHQDFVWLNQPNAPIIDEQWMISDPQKVAAAQMAKFQHEMSVDGMTLELSQKAVRSQGIELTMAMEMDIYTFLRQLGGNLKKFEFVDGSFDVSASIIGSNMGSDQNANILLSDIGTLEVDNVEIKEGRLFVNFPDFILQNKPTNGNLILALQVAPHGISGEVLKPYKVIYRMGDFYQWLGKKSPLKIRDNNADVGKAYDELLKTVEVSKEKVNAARAKVGMKKLEAFEFDYFDIDYNSIKPGETATTRTVSYNVRVCVKQPLRGNRPAENETFAIRTLTNGKVKDIGTKTTDHNGCMGWIDEVSHYYYKPEKYILNSITLSHTSGFKKDLKIAINPWDLFATFGKDLQRDPEVLTKIIEEEKWEKEHPDIPYKIESRINVNNFGYTAIKFDYEIKKDLSLNVQKSVLMKIDPEVQRYSSMTYGRKAVEWLRDGIWLLKIAIHKDYLDPAQKGAVISRSATGPQFDIDKNINISEKHYISYQKKLVRVINGRIVTPVTFEMKDLRLMRIRSNLLIQLEPIDETQLLLANWLGRELDKRAYLDDRQRQDFDEFKEAILNFVDVNFGSDSNKVDGDLEKFRVLVNPKKLEVMDIYKNESLSDDEKRLLGEQEIVAKNNYRN